jgi:cytoskeletal protein CcmA (bactofilin family)
MADARDSITVIGPDTQIKGEMTFESGACILGKFEGRIATRGELQIGETAVCKANIDAGRVVIDGAIEGDVVARERLELNAGATVAGDITAAKLVVAEGATFIGHCRVGEAAIKQAGDAPAGVTGTKPTDPNHAGPIHIETARVTTGRAARAAASHPAAMPPVGDIESALAGFETKLAELGRSRTAQAAGE